jgi:hypothetical protein
MPFFEPLPFTGRVTYLGLVKDRQTSLASSAVDELDCDFGGAVGDYHYGTTRPSHIRLSGIYPPGTLIRNTRQISIVSEEDCAEIARRMGIGEIRPEWLGATLQLRGIPRFSLLPPSTRLIFSTGATLVVDLENPPCSHPGRLMPPPAQGGLAFRAAAENLRGVCAWVERPGRINASTMVSPYIPSQPPYPVTNWTAKAESNATVVDREILPA